VKRLFVGGVLIAAFLSVAGTAHAGQAQPNHKQIVLHRGGHDATVAFRTGKAGEVAFDVTASAPAPTGVPAATNQSVVSVYADGHYQTDIVIPFGTPIARHFTLGHLGRRPA